MRVAAAVNEGDVNHKYENKNRNDEEIITKNDNDKKLQH